MDINLEKIAIKLNTRVPSNELIQDVKELLNNLDFIKGINFNVHPLGFLHTKLGSFESLGDLRLHIWGDDDRKQQSPLMPIHDHIFTVNSFVLCGRVTNHNYNIFSDVTNYDCNYKLYDAEYDGDKSFLNSTEKLIYCELNNKEIIEQGQYYSVEKGRYHQTSVEEGVIAATLVLSTEINNSHSPNILGDINGDSQYVFQRYTTTYPAIERLKNLI